MVNHPNRSKNKSIASTPTIEMIKSAREAVGLTQKEAGELIMYTGRAWEKWETGERRMHPATYDYFLIKTDQKA